MAKSPLVERNLRKFAHLLGGEDEKGVKHPLAKTERERDAVRRQHLFWVKNRHNENALGTFKLGDVMIETIREDLYDIEYMGLNRNAMTNKKVQKKMRDQIDDIMKGIRAKDERLGIYKSDDDYEERRQELLDATEKRFEEVAEKAGKR